MPSNHYFYRLILTAALASGIANAQVLEEVIVTSTKRIQSVQDVPTAVSV